MRLAHSDLIMLSGSILLTAATPFFTSIQNPAQDLPLQKRVSAPSVSGDGICFTHVLQAQDSCQSLAQQYSLTGRDIENFNSKTWGWHGCGSLQQGDFICLSPGDPPMPAALGQAICGPQVPGTARPGHYSELASLNPCVSGDCCSLSGLCGSTPDFCSKENCISNCEVVAPAPTAEKAPAEPPRIDTTIVEAERATETQKDDPKAVQPPLPTESWEITIYSRKGCTGNYYLLTGYNNVRKDRYDIDDCVDLTGDTSTDVTQARTSCRWWKDEGLSWTKCSESPLKDPKSWRITSGDCTAYSDRKCKSQAGRIYGSWLGCQDSTGAPLTPKTFRSLVCVA